MVSRIELVKNLAQIYKLEEEGKLGIAPRSSNLLYRTMDMMHRFMKERFIPALKYWIENEEELKDMMPSTIRDAKRNLPKAEKVCEQLMNIPARTGDPIKDAMIALDNAVNMVHTHTDMLFYLSQWEKEMNPEASEEEWEEMEGLFDYLQNRVKKIAQVNRIELVKDLARIYKLEEEGKLGIAPGSENLLYKTMDKLYDFMQERFLKNIRFLVQNEEKLKDQYPDEIKRAKRILPKIEKAVNQLKSIPKVSQDPIKNAMIALDNVINLSHIHANTLWYLWHWTDDMNPNASEKEWEEMEELFDYLKNRAQKITNTKRKTIYSEKKRQKTASEEVIVYHGTPKKNIQKIREEGFKLDVPRSHGGKKRGIYVSLYPNVGTYSQGGGIIKCKVDKKYLIPDPDEDFPGQFLVKDPSKLEIIDIGEYKDGNLYPTWDSQTKTAQEKKQEVPEQYFKSDWILVAKIRAPKGAEFEETFCDNCGRQLFRNLYTVKNRKTGEIKEIGIECMKKVTGMTASEIEAEYYEAYNQWRREEAEQEMLIRVKENIKEFKEVNQDVFDFLRDNHEQHDFLNSVWKQLNERGTLTEKQIEAVKKFMKTKYVTLPENMWEFLKSEYKRYAQTEVPRSEFDYFIFIEDCYLTYKRTGKLSERQKQALEREMLRRGYEIETRVGEEISAKGKIVDIDVKRSSYSGPGFYMVFKIEGDDGKEYVFNVNPGTKAFNQLKELAGIEERYFGSSAIREFKSNLVGKEIGFSGKIKFYGDSMQLTNVRISSWRKTIYSKEDIITLYHATFNQLFPKIMREGLKKGSYFADDPQIAIDHFWKKYEVALGQRRWHRSREEIEKRLKGLKPQKPMTIALLEVDIPRNWLERHGRYYYSLKKIPPQNIRLTGNFGQIAANEMAENKRRIIFSRIEKEEWQDILANEIRKFILSRMPYKIYDWVKDTKIKIAEKSEVGSRERKFNAFYVRASDTIFIFFDILPDINNLEEALNNKRFLQILGHEYWHAFSLKNKRWMEEIMDELKDEIEWRRTFREYEYKFREYVRRWGKQYWREMGKWQILDEMMAEALGWIIAGFGNPEELAKQKIKDDMLGWLVSKIIEKLSKERRWMKLAEEIIDKGKVKIESEDELKEVLREIHDNSQLALVEANILFGENVKGLEDIVNFLVLSVEPLNKIGDFIDSIKKMMLAKKKREKREAGEKIAQNAEEFCKIMEEAIDIAKETGNKLRVVGRKAIRIYGHLNRLIQHARLAVSFTRELVNSGVLEKA